MKQKDIHVGGHYLANVSGKRVTVKVDRVPGTDVRGFHVTNMVTGRRCVFHSCRRFLSAVDPDSPEPKVRRQLRREATAYAEELLNGKSATLVMPGAKIVRHETPLATTLRRSIEHVNGAATVPDRPAEPEEDGLQPDQVRAFRVVTGRIEAGERFTKLCGYAGTGKTFLIARIAAWALRNGWSTIVAAPTHKACGVLSEKMERFKVSGVECRTIHSLLGLRLEIDMENDTGGRILRKNDDAKQKPLSHDLVIVDEASMIGQTLKREIEEIDGTRWLFVGDLAQLPPVGESVSELLDDPDATLTQVLRQAEGSEILNLATRVRQGDVSLDHEPGWDVVEDESAESMFQTALERFRSDEYQTNASHARMLVFRNDRRSAINQRMRGLLIGKEEPYAAGEWLVMYAAFAPEKSKLNLLAEAAKRDRSRWKEFYRYKEGLSGLLHQLHVSQEVRVFKAEAGKIRVEDWTFDVWNLDVETSDGSKHRLPVLWEQDQREIAVVKAQVAEAARSAREVRDGYAEGCQQWQHAEQNRRRAWGIYFTLDESFAQVDYAYAMTVHKSQGSTFDHVYVDVPDVMTAGGGMRDRMLYTAFTRPAKSLTFYR